MERMHPDDLRAIIAAIYDAGSNIVYNQPHSLRLADKLMAAANGIHAVEPKP